MSRATFGPLERRTGRQPILTIPRLTLVDICFDRSTDVPVVDTAETVHISSLALLKMLKHGAFGFGRSHSTRSSMRVSDMNNFSKSFSCAPLFDLALQVALVYPWK